jgi:hypothetical protein
MDVLKQYRILHESPDFCRGSAIKEHLDAIEGLCKKYECKTLLDYGCGKAMFYKQGIADKWGVEATLYDPGVPEYSEKPSGQFDCVVCVDVLEHVEDPEKTIKDIMSYPTKAAFIQVCTQPSDITKKKRRLLDGRGLHISVYPSDWWTPRILKAAPEDVSLTLLFS